MKEMLINRIKKHLLPVVLTTFFVSVAIAAVEPNAVIVYFLPVQDTASVDSPHASKYVPTKTGVVIAKTTDNLPEKSKIDEKHGIKTPVGVSLYDKGETPLATAQENVLAPVKVMILPPEDLVKKDRKAVKGTPDSVVPLPIRIFPLLDLKKEIETVNQKEEDKPLFPEAVKAAAKEKDDDGDPRPYLESEWPAWIFRQLKTCEGSQKAFVLATLYRMMGDKKPLGKTDCEIKREVAKFLQKCYPWPADYYTPDKFDYPPENIQIVRMAIEVLSSRFGGTKFCPLDLTHINFEKNDFIRTHFDEADFSYSNFNEASFLNARIQNSIFQKAEMDNVLIQESSFEKAYMKGVRMRFGHIIDSDVSMAFFQQADLTNTQFRRSKAVLADFSQAKLANTAWEDVEGVQIDFSDSDLTKAVFNNVLFEKMEANGTDFSNLVCRDCQLQGAEAQDAWFYQGQFNTVSFKNADLSGANFSKTVFEPPIVLSGVKIYDTDFKGADIRFFEGLTAEQLRLTLIDADTQLPKPPEDFESASYDVDIFRDTYEEKGEIAYGCTQKMCEDRLKGRVSNTNLALRAMSFIDAPNTSFDEKMWALCTMGCIARYDKKLEPSQIDILAAFVRRNSKWSSEDLFKPYTPLKPEVQTALFILTDPAAGIHPSYDIDLSGTDLRGADLSNSDLRAFTFRGANLSGANLSGSIVDDAFNRFDRAVVDQFTVLPKNVSRFMPYQLPEELVWPRWWKPGTVRVIKDTVNLWYPITETIPFSDDFIVRPIGLSASNETKDQKAEEPAQTTENASAETKEGAKAESKGEKSEPQQETKEKDNKEGEGKNE